MAKRKLTKLKFYGAGRMGSDVRDKTWRTEITEHIEKIGEFWNPYLLEPVQLRGLRPGRLPKTTPDGKLVKHWYDLRNFPKISNEYKRFKKYMEAIIEYDLGLVKKADVILVRWSDGCKSGGGTHGEVSYAKILNKQVFCFNESKDKLPEWIEGCCTEVFDNMEEMLKFLFDEYGDSDDVPDFSEELIN